MGKQNNLIVMLLVILASLAIIFYYPNQARAGDLEPPGALGQTMHTLDEIYELVLDTNSKVTPAQCQGAPVEKTEQTASYATGDDGDLQRGIAWPNPRFTDNGDGTVTDNLTELMWTKNASLYGVRTWSVALADCDACTEGGYSDWNLPNVKELQSLINYRFAYPPLSDTAGTGYWSEGDPFTGVQGAYYWSGTTCVCDTGYAWYVEMGYGNVRNQSKSLNGFVWCVRGEH